MQFERVQTSENPTKTAEVTEEARGALVQRLAAAFHDEVWKEQFRSEHHETTRPKSLNLTQDTGWLQDTENRNRLTADGKIDILNTDFADLPPSWQSENTAAASFVIDRLLEVYESGGLSALAREGLVEELAAEVHDIWLVRNEEYASKEQQQAYAALPRTEQLKDREQVERGIKLLQEAIGRRDTEG